MQLSTMNSCTGEGLMPALPGDIPDVLVNEFWCLLITKPGVHLLSQGCGEWMCRRTIFMEANVQEEPDELVVLPCDFLEDIGETWILTSQKPVLLF